MSNKLVEHKESKEILTGNQKKILFWICFIILSIAFITVWINILLTSKAFNTQMEEMVLGEDYYMEDIVITGKRAEDASADTISQNYFFYYNNGKVNDYHKRMQVPGFVYSEYNVGDSIAAYTTDHVSYSYYKYGMLPDTEYTKNELQEVTNFPFIGKSQRTKNRDLGVHDDNKNCYNFTDGSVLHLLFCKAD